MREQLLASVGNVARFVYGNDEREVEIETVKDAANGNVLLVGKDINKNNEYRSFSLTKMQGLNIIPKGWSRV